MDKAKNQEERGARDFEVKDVEDRKGLQPPPPIFFNVRLLR